MRDLIRTTLRRSLAAAGLARTTAVDRERRRAEKTRARERARADRVVAAAAARLTALGGKLHAAQERLVAERAESRFQRGLYKEYRERLTRAQTDLARSVAAERRLSSMFGGYEERLSAQLAGGAERMRRGHDAAVITTALHASVSSEYTAGASRWRAGDTAATTRTVMSGLQWSTCAGAPSSTQGAPPFPLDDIAAVRQFVVGGVMLDIGAGAGEASIPRVLLGDFSAAYATEPDANRFLCLIGNTLDNHLEGHVLPDRVTIGGTNDAGAGAPSLTLDAWVARVQAPADDIRFVRISAPGSELSVLQGAASLLRRRDVVWHVIASPDAAAGDLGALLAAHFTHVRVLDTYAQDQERPASNAAAILRTRADEGRCASLLLFNRA